MTPLGRSGGPLLCLITDSRRLLAPSAPFREARACLLTQLQHAIDAGVDIVQVREHAWEAAQLADMVSAMAALARGSTTRIVVNDRLDVAIAAAADGVHLRGNSFEARRVRAIAKEGFLIGRSVHSAEDAVLHAPGADYLIAGTVFPTVSKPADHPLLGLAGLAAIVRAVAVPVLAVGGIRVDRLEGVAATGAAGIAAVGLFVGAADRSGCRAVPLVPIVEAGRRQFDSASR